MNRRHTMIHIFNGGDKAVGAIGVTYPEGSTCTCANANGTKTYTAKTTTGQWLFSVPTAGEWTLACTDGTDSISRKVTVTEGKLTTETLSYVTYIVKGGVFQTGYSLMQAMGTIWGDTTATKVVTQYEDFFSVIVDGAYISPTIDVTNYSKVALDIMPTKMEDGSTFQIGLATGRYTDDSTWLSNSMGNVTKNSVGTLITVELNASEITGNVYLKMVGSSQSAAFVIIDVYNVYLKE